MSDPNDTCPHCRRAFTDEDLADDPAETCGWCGLDLHAWCVTPHMCPERRLEGKAALRAWELSSADWRKPRA